MGGAKSSVKSAPYTSRQDPKPAVFCTFFPFLPFSLKSEVRRLSAFSRGFCHLGKLIHEAGVS